MDPRPSHHRSKKMEADQKRRARLSRDAAAEPLLQSPLPLVQDAYVLPHPPSLLWRDFRTQIGYLPHGDKELVKKAFGMIDKNLLLVIGSI